MRCPLNKYAINSLCVEKRGSVEHLTLAGNLKVKLVKPSSIDIASFSVKSQFIKSLNATIVGELFVNCVVESMLFTAQLTHTTITEVFVKVMVSTSAKCPIDALLAKFTFIEREMETPFHAQNSKFSYDIGMFYDEYPNGHSIRLVSGSCDQVVHLQRFFYCPRVVLSVSEYNKSVESGRLRHLGDFVYRSDSAFSSRSIEICVSEYERSWKLNFYENLKPAKPESDTPLIIVASTACSLLSMVCIAFVLVTFALFKELRYMPGKLFALLALNLLIAQGLYAFGIGVGGSGYACMFIGIAIHYFWLAVCFSMNSCIILMFSHFHCPLRSSSRTSVLDENKPDTDFIKFAIYTHTCPFVFILANIFASLVMTGYKSIGYGGEICYISFALMRGILFALPLGVTILVNFILFGIIMYDIEKVTSHNISTKCDKGCKKTAIFAKFSTITGIYWTFGYLYELTDLEFIGMVSIFLNAGQGIFLMVSFLFNRTVVRLYKGMFCDIFARAFSRQSFSVNQQNIILQS